MPASVGGIEDGDVADAVSVVVPGDREVSLGAEVNLGDIFDCPESGGGAEDGDIGDAVAIIIAADRDIPQGSVIDSPQAPDRPEAGGRPEDRDIRFAVTGIIASLKDQVGTGVGPNGGSDSYVVEEDMVRGIGPGIESELEKEGAGRAEISIGPAPNQEVGLGLLRWRKFQLLPSLE